MLPQKQATRLVEIDILKGIGIICVVLAHAQCPEYQFLYLFHLAIFFLAAGYCFKIEKISDFPKLVLFIRKRFTSLYIPFVVTSFILWGYDQFFEYICNDSINISLSMVTHNAIRCCLLLGSPYSAGALWFLRDLLLISCTYVVLLFLFNRIFSTTLSLVIVTVLGFVILVLGWFFLLKSFIPNYIFHECATFWLLPVGTLFSKYKHFCVPKERIAKSLILLISLCVLIILYIDLFCIRLRIDIAVGVMNSLIGYVIASLSGWFFVFIISDNLKRFSVGNILAYIGQHGLCVFMLHLAVFRLFTLSYLLVNSVALTEIKRFPVLNNSLWLSYTVLGIGVPLLLLWGCQSIINAIRLKKQ